MGSYDDIGTPVKGQPISSGAYGLKVRAAIWDLDKRVSAYDTTSNTGKSFLSTSLTLASTGEAQGLLITGMVFKAGLAYEATMRMGLVTAAANTFVNCRIRKYNASPSAGADWGEYFRFQGNAGVGGSSPQSCLGSIFLLNNTSADITSDVNFTVQCSVSGASAAIVYANATSPRFFIIKPAGFAADYSGIGVQVS